MSYTFSDVIGFGGAFALGMTQAGFTMRAKREVLNFGVKNAEGNRHLLGWEWDAQVKPMSRNPDWDIVKTDVVTGNPPCSGFSTMTSAQYRGMDAAINDCMWAFTSYVGKSAPYIAAFESVQQAYSQGRDLMTTLRDRVERDTGLEYHLYHVLHNAISLGGPAVRPRYFWLISRVPFGMEFPEPELVPTFRETVGDLRGLSETWEKQPYAYPETWWSHRRRSPDGSVDGHMTRRLMEWKRMTALFDALDGDWPPGMKCEDAVRKIYERHGKLPDIWETQTERLLKRNFVMGPNQPVRWKSEKACRVITGAALNVAIHPTENRLITHREAARIQGFPDDWHLWPVREYKKLHATHGKGVPVDSGRWLGYWMKRALDGNPGSMIGTPDGDRESVFRLDKGYKKALERGGRRKHEFWAANA